MEEAGTNYRLYADGKIVHQDDFEEENNTHPFSSIAFTMYFIPDAILEYIKVDEENPRCSFCNKTKKEVGTPVIKGENANICYKCVATNKKKLEEGEKK